MKRRAFSLLMAIMFIVLVSTIGMLALSFSTQASKQTSDVYMKAQAELLSRSATEYAMLALSAHNISATPNCIKSITATFPSTSNPLFNIKVDMQYIGKDLPSGCPILNNVISTVDSNVTILMDTYVSSKDGLLPEPIRIHRRTIQKP